MASVTPRGNLDVLARTGLSLLPLPRLNAILTHFLVYTRVSLRSSLSSMPTRGAHLLKSHLTLYPHI